MNDTNGNVLDVTLAVAQVRTRVVDIQTRFHTTFGQTVRPADDEIQEAEVLVKEAKAILTLRRDLDGLESVMNRAEQRISLAHGKKRQA
jgi:hypothetical protein